MSFFKPLFALLLVALVGGTAVACTGSDTDSAEKSE